MAKNENNTNVHPDEALLKKNLKGAVNVIYHTSNSLLVRAITKSKRKQLDKNILNSMKNGSGGRVGNVYYITPRIITLKVTLLSLTLFFKLITRLRQGVIS